MLKNAQIQGAQQSLSASGGARSETYRTGEFAKAEEELFTMVDAEPNNERLMEFGCAFYRRLLAQSDSALNNANLPRSEVEEGLKQLEARRKP